MKKVSVNNQTLEAENAWLDQPDLLDRLLTGFGKRKGKFEKPVAKLIMISISAGVMGPDSSYHGFSFLKPALKYLVKFCEESRRTDPDDPAKLFFMVFDRPQGIGLVERGVATEDTADAMGDRLGDNFLKEVSPLLFGPRVQACLADVNDLFKVPSYGDPKGVMRWRGLVQSPFYEPGKNAAISEFFNNKPFQEKIHEGSEKYHDILKEKKLLAPGRDAKKTIDKNSLFRLLELIPDYILSIHGHHYTEAYPGTKNSGEEHWPLLAGNHEFKRIWLKKEFATQSNEAMAEACQAPAATLSGHVPLSVEPIPDEWLEPLKAAEARGASRPAPIAKPPELKS